MANPYDFTSGALSAFQLSEARDARIAGDKFRDEVLKPYYAGRAGMYDSQKALLGAQSRLYGFQADTAGFNLEQSRKGARRREPFLNQYFPENQPGSGLKDKGKQGGLGLKDPNSGTNMPSLGSWYSADDVGNSFTLGFNASPEENNFQDEMQYAADGTRGGLQIRGYNDGRMPVTNIATNGLAGPDALLNSGQDLSLNGIGRDSTQLAQAPGERQKLEINSALPTLQENNPQAFGNLEKNIFGASNKEFQKMIGAFSMLDWAEGKITSEQLRTTSQAIKKMQVENLGGAMQFALAGNEKAAIARFAESGDDRGEDIAGIKKIQFSNPIPGAAKKTNDTYDGLEITYKNGSSIKLDPRRLLAETVALKEVVDNEYRFNDSIRRNDASIYATDAQNNATTENAASRKEQRELELNRQILNNVSEELKADQANEMKLWESQNKTIDNKLYPAAQRKFQQDIDRNTRPYANIAAINVGIFNNKNVSYSAVKEAVMSGDFQGVTQPDGTKIPNIFEKNGTKYLQSPNGIYFPVPVKPR
jgi:hypothetical protein